MFEDIKELKPFTQHGFKPQKKEKDNYIGNCPFCGKKNKFGYNVKTKKWNCFVCGKGGGFTTWLNTITNENEKTFTEETSSILIDNRKCITHETFEYFNMGFNINTLCYTLPIFNATYDDVRNIKIFNPMNKSFISTADCSQYMFNVWNITDKHINIWLCEGEWDAIALQQILVLLGLDKTDIAVAVPGANQFKEKWVSYFKNKNVFCVYDNDDAGNQGTGKVFLKLSGHANLRFIHWPKDTKDKYDIRDLIQDKTNPIKFMKFVKSLLRQAPRIETKALKTENRLQISDDNPFIEPQKVYDVYNKWLWLEDNDVIDILFGTVLGNRLPGDPVWLFLVAPAGCSKTTLCMAMSQAPNMFPVTTLTGPSLCSGINVGEDNDPSLIPQWDGQCVIVKDFTTILSLPDQHQEEIFGVLRDAYDGVFDKFFGNGVTRKYKSKFGMIAGVTPAIEIFDHHTAVGERFFKWEIKPPEDTSDFLMRALKNTNKEEEMFKEMSMIANSCLAHNFDEIPEISEDILDKIVALAQWLAMVRGTVVRDKYSKEITHLAFQELGTRLCKQFSKLITGIAMFHGKEEAGEYEYNLLKKVSWFSVTSKLRYILKHMFESKRQKAFTIEDIIKVLALPKITVQRAVDNLVLLKVLEVDKKHKLKLKYKITDRVKLLMEDAEL